MAEASPAGAPAALHGLLMIRTKDLHVTYRVRQDRSVPLRSRVAHPTGSRDRIDVHAVRGVNLDVGAGETLGIVGSNGSGKSSFLRALAGLQPPSSGDVLTRNQPVLMGVGSALNQNLSGRRNIIIGGLALGMKRSEVEERMPEIIEFSGLNDAIDRPMRTYSSGMRARLHFAIATSQTPKILLLDEALSVGDKAFKAQCIERLGRMREQAGVVVMATHSLSEVKSNCTRAVWIKDGTVVADGNPDDVVAAYQSS